jgi:hypothetical protein
MEDPTTAAYNPTHENWIHDHGSFPMVSWSPNYTITQMNAGSADAIWAKAANYLKTYPFTIILRAFPEFNLDCYTYAAVPCSLNGNVNSCGTPFINAWHRMVNVFQTNGASNVGFMFNMDEGNNRGCVNSSYPGDAYVDWVGADNYNTCSVGDGSCSSTPLYTGFAQLADLFFYSGSGGLSTGDTSCIGGAGVCRTWSQYDIFSSGTATRNTIVQTNGLPAELPTKKPFIIGETETVYRSQSLTPKGDWFRNFVAPAQTLTYLRGISFFDAIVAVSYRVDYDTSNVDIYNGYKTLAAAPWFNTSLP